MKNVKSLLTDKVESEWNERTGFTLLELIITLAIISLLSMFAFNSYENILIKTRRLDAKTTLLTYHTALQECFIELWNYEECAKKIIPNPENSIKGFYKLVINTTSPTHYLLSAITTLIQEKDTACHTFTINTQQSYMAYTINGQENPNCW